MLVGEQPGHEEDLSGRPFVGPAGRLLDRALEAAGLDRPRVYLTNVVKHFNWEPRGKWRIHKKPTAWHVQACRPWLIAELAAVRPGAVVCLGATAAPALLGRGVRVTRSRGVADPSELAGEVFATLHPSAVLRAPDTPPARRRWRASWATCRPSLGASRAPVRVKEEAYMDEEMLDSVVGPLMSDSSHLRGGGVPGGHADRDPPDLHVARRRAGVWVIVNWPN